MACKITIKKIKPVKVFQRRYRKETIIKLKRVSATFLYIKEHENQNSNFLCSYFLIKV